MSNSMSRSSVVLSGLLLGGSLLAQGLGGVDEPPPRPPRIDPHPSVEGGSGAVQVWEEYGKAFKSRNSVAALDASVFGDSVDLSNGALSFSVTDVNVPGNSSLPVAITRTLSVTSRAFDSDNDRPFADWELDIPRLEGVYSTIWTAFNGSQQRCDQTTQPPSISVSFSINSKPANYLYDADQYWSGVTAHMAGGGELMVADEPGTPRPTLPGGGGNPAYKWVTPGYVYFECLNALANPSATINGQGFKARAPDGSTYYFNHMAQYHEAPVGNDSAVPAPPIPRRRNVLYATKVEDRFGHWVQYHYDNQPHQPLKLTSITASDGRSLTVTHVPGSHRIRNVTENAGALSRSWTYDYATINGWETLTTVTLPDTSKWTLDLLNLSSSELQYNALQKGRTCTRNELPQGIQTPDGQILGNGTPAFGEITHPSGAKGRFEVLPLRHGRSNVPQFCKNVDPLGGGYSDDVPVYFRDYDTLTLTRKMVTGPALPTMTWDYSYASNRSWLGGGWQNVGGGPLPPTCNGNCVFHVCRANDPNKDCVDVNDAISETIVVGPPFADNEDLNQRIWTRYTHGNSFRYNEGKLLKVDRGELPLGGNPSNGFVMESTSTEYMLPTAAPPAETRIGRSLQATGDGFTTEYPRPRTRETILRDGTCFRWEGFMYDPFYRPTAIERTRIDPDGPTCPQNNPIDDVVSSTIETYQFWESMAAGAGALEDWVIGQVHTKTNHSKGLPEARTEYDSNSHLPMERYAFGKLQEKIEYHERATGSLVPTGCTDLEPSTALIGCFGGLPERVSDASGLKWTSFPAYVRGMPSSVEYEEGESESVEVNARGEITTHTGPAGYPTSYKYDSMGRLNEIQYPQDSVTWHGTYIIFAPLSQSVFGLPAQTASTPGSWRRIVFTGPPLQPPPNNIIRNAAVSATYYDAFWRPVVTETYEVDTNGAVIADTRSIVNTKYDPAGREIFSAYPVRSDDEFGIDHYDDSVDGRYSYFDGLGRIFKTSQDSEPPLRLANPLTVSYSYQDGFVTEISDQDQRKTRIHYQAYDKPTTDYPVKIESPKGLISNPQAFITTDFTRDAFGKPLTVQRTTPAMNGSPAFTLTRSFRYDLNERLCKRIDPEGGATFFYYDSSNNIDWQGLSSDVTEDCEDTNQVANGDRIDFSYDNRNRLTSTTYLDGQTVGTTRSWTPDGLPLTVTQGDSQWAYAYNERRMLEAEVLTLQGTGGQTYSMFYDYDAHGSLATAAYPDASAVAFLPNRLGQPTIVGTSQTDGYARSVNWHPNGALSSFTYGNLKTYQVDLNERLLPERTRISGVLDDQYVWDAVGNLKQITDGLPSTGHNRTRTLRYDYANRLIQAWSTATIEPTWNCGITGAECTRYEYDDLDNLRLAVNGGTTYTYQYDFATTATGRLDSLKVGSTEVMGYAYDSRGNVTEREPASAFGVAAHEFVVDKAHRMNEVRSHGGSDLIETYEYDGNGRRVRISNNAGTRVQIYNQAGQFVYERFLPAAAGSSCSTDDPTHLIFCSGFEPVSGGGGGVETSTRYLYLDDKLIAQVSNGSTSYIHTDHLGSVVATSDASGGSLTFRGERNPYGAPTNPGDYVQGPDYTGHVTDQVTGLSYMQARYYDPLAGRFLGTDPVHVDLSSGGNFNRYWYANNNPYGFVDPDGRQACGTRVLGGGAFNCRSVSLFDKTPSSSESDPDSGGFSPASGPYLDQSGQQVNLAAIDYGSALSDSEGNIYSFDWQTGTAYRLPSDAIEPVAPESYLLGAGGALKTVYVLFQARSGAHIFFSGGDKAAMFAFAAERQGLGGTIFSTRAGSIIQGLPPGLRSALWGPTSALFAATTSRANVYLGSTVLPRSVWRVWEAPVLRVLRKPTTINDVP